MIGVRVLQAYVPPKSMTIDDLVIAAGESLDLLAPMRAGGLRSVPVASSLEELVEGVLKMLPSRAAPIACFFAHSLAHQGEASIALRRHFSNSPVIDIGGQPCAILHFAIHAASRWLQRNGSASDEVLVVGADHAQKPTDRLFFNSAMGDAAVALLLGHVDHQLALLATRIETNLIACEGTKSDPEAISKFRAANSNAIRAAITECARQAGLRIDDVAFLFPHTPYTTIWDAVAQLLRYPRERIVTEGVSRTGHLNSNDSFVHLSEALRSGRLRPGDIVMAVNPGFGGTRGCTLLRVERTK